MQEGLERTVESYQHLRAQIKSKREGPSKASMCLGSGRGMDHPTILGTDAGNLKPF